MAKHTKGHTDPRSRANAVVEVVIMTGDPDSDETCERFVAAEASTGANTWGDTWITVKHFKNAVGASGREIDNLTIADARALLVCLEAILAKVPLAARFVREGEQLAMARGRG